MAELKVIKFNEAMSGPNKKKWEKATNEEHDHMLKLRAQKMVKHHNVPKAHCY
jgi:hypothetical protein